MKICKRKRDGLFLRVIILLMVIPAHMMAQQVISPGGGSVSTGSITLSFTLGEPVTGTLMAGDKIVTQGFQQPSRVATMVPFERTESTSVRVYPNPFVSFVEIEVQDAGGKHWEVEVLDLRGTKVSVESFFTAVGRIDLTGLLPGCYLLRVSQPGRGYLFSGKIIRN